jgi:hypothetical protein
VSTSAAVGRRQDGRAVSTPGLDDAVDRRRAQVGSVRQDDHRRLDHLVERAQAAAKRRARAGRPFRAVNRAPGGVDRVRAENDDDVVDRGGRLDPFEHAGEQDPLLRRPEPARLPRGQHDGGDHCVLRGDERFRQRS